MIPLLSDLREPPVVGRFYMVPTVTLSHPWPGPPHTWPVIGVRHEDAAELDFPWLHWHLDYRFMGLGLERLLVNGGWTGIKETDRMMAVANSVLTGRTERDRNAPRGFAQPNPPPSTATLRKMRCWRDTYTFPDNARDYVSLRLNRVPFKSWSQPAEPVHLADGRLICPHKGADLSQFPPDKHGIVVCPLHGLRVQCVALRAPAIQTAVQEEMVL